MQRKLTRIFILLLVLVASLVAWRLYLSHAIRRELASIRTAGLPANGEELNRWYAAVPDNQNAALVLMQAFALRQLYPDSRSNLIFNFKLPKRGEALTQEQTELLRGYVSLNEARLQKSDEALRFHASRYPIDCTQLMNTPLPHLGWLKEIAELHEYSALLALESGRASTASSNIVTVLALARTLDGEPCLISQLVKLKLFTMAFVTLEHRANSAAFSPEELTTLATAFSQTGVSNTALIGLIGDRAMTIPYFQMSESDYSKLNPAKDSDELRKNSPLPCHGPLILKLIGYYELDFGSYLIGMNKALTLLSNVPPDNLLASGYFARVGEASKERQRTLSGATLANYAGVPWRENEAIAQQRLALVALALERFRSEKIKLPEKLEELVPQFLDEIPKDPFLGKELSYRRTEKGYILYSVGPDREDNNGLEEDDKKQSEDKKSYDITFTVER